MSFQRRGWGIHVVSAELTLAADRESPVTIMLWERKGTKGYKAAAQPPPGNQKLGDIIAPQRHGRDIHAYSRSRAVAAGGDCLSRERLGSAGVPGAPWARPGHLLLAA